MRDGFFKISGKWKQGADNCSLLKLCDQLTPKKKLYKITEGLLTGLTSDIQ